MTNFMELDDLESMEQKLESILQRRTPMVDSRTIALIASKRNFDPVKESHLREKARTTKCKCRHYTQTSPCLYRRCRHAIHAHPEGAGAI